MPQPNARAHWWNCTLFPPSTVLALLVERRTHAKRRSKPRPTPCSISRLDLDRRHPPLQRAALSWCLLAVSSNHMIWDRSTSTIRFVHVASDTIVLYGVLRERFRDGGGGASGGGGSASGRSSPSSSASRGPAVFLPLQRRFSLRRPTRGRATTFAVPVAPLLTSEG